MIIILRDGKVSVKQMNIPERLDKLHIQYDYEFGTNHLKPRLTVNGTVFEGDRIAINVERDRRIKFQDQVNLKVRVDLLDGEGNLTRIYKGELPYYRYCVFGTKPVHPNVEAYVRELEDKIEKLENEGEVI